MNSYAQPSEIIKLCIFFMMKGKLKEHYCCMCSNRVKIYLGFAAILCFMGNYFLMYQSWFTIIGGPNCQMKTNNSDDLRFLLNKVIAVFEKHNVTYWLDYGSALGAYR